jgi:hypothetical protein
MTPAPIEVLRVSGTHREVGLQMGEWGRERIQAEIASVSDELPAGRSWDAQMALAGEYRAFTAPRLPWLIDELDGCAEAAGVDPLVFFASSMEEIWYEPRPPRTQGRCSDLVAGPPATADGHLLVGTRTTCAPAQNP